MKKRNKKILIFSFIFLIILLVSISIILVSNAYNSETTSIDKEKIFYEIKYLDEKVIYMANSLNHLNDTVYTPNMEANWDSLLNDMERIYQYWSITILDLNNLSIEKTDLTDFGKILDNMVISIKNKDKQECLDNIVQLYTKLTIYSENLKYDENDTLMMKAKYHLLVSYSLAPKGNWTLTHESILKSDELLFHAINSMNDQDNQYSINQAYVAVKELENIIHVKDLDVFYLKYKIAMQKLGNL